MDFFPLTLSYFWVKFLRKKLPFPPSKLHLSKSSHNSNLNYFFLSYKVVITENYETIFCKFNFTEIVILFFAVFAFSLRTVKFNTLLFFSLFKLFLVKVFEKKKTI